MHVLNVNKFQQGKQRVSITLHKAHTKVLWTETFLAVSHNTENGKRQHANRMRCTTRLFSIHAIIFFAAHERRENHRESAANICCFDENEKKIPMRFSRLSIRWKKIIKHRARSLYSPVFSWISDCLEINKKSSLKVGKFFVYEKEENSNLEPAFPLWP